jgi:hypothetical protein
MAKDKDSGGSKPLSGAKTETESEMLRRTLGETAALEKAASGQGFPVRGEAASAASRWSPGRPTTTEVPDRQALGEGSVPSGAFKAGMDLEAALLLHAEGFTDEAAKAIAEAKLHISRQKPPAPTQVTVGNRMLVKPQALFDVPVALHEGDSTLAMQLFDIFCSRHKNRVMRLAAKAGHPSMPFFYLTQALWELFEIHNFKISPRLCPEGERLTHEDGRFMDECFDPDEAHPSDLIQKGLRLWAGEEFAETITRRCAEGDISIICGLKQCYRKLDENRQADLERGQKFNTVHQWTKADEQDED